MKHLIIRMIDAESFINPTSCNWVKANNDDKGGDFCQWRMSNLAAS